MPLQDYTCQLFLRYKCEIFILGVLGFLKTTWSFLKIPEEVRSLPNSSEVCWRRAHSQCFSLLKSEIARKVYIVIYSFYTWFSFLTWVWVNIFLEIVSSNARRQQLTFFNQAWEIGPQAWDRSFQPAGVRLTSKVWELAGIQDPPNLKWLWTPL